MSNRTKRFGPFEVDFSAPELRKSGIAIHIQEQPLRILEALVEKRAELVTREELRHRLWASDTYVDFERNLNAAVAKLRQVLHDSAERPVYIETVARKGYRFIAPVTTDANAVEVAAPPISAPSKMGWRISRLPMAVIAILATIAGWSVAKWSWRARQEEKAADSIRFAVSLPKNLQISPRYGPQIAISPRGRKLVVVASRDGTRMLWWRGLDAENWNPIPASEGAVMPFWSDDERALGFYSRGRIWRVAMPAGPVRAVCSAPFFFGATWSRGTILFSSEPEAHAGAELYRVAADGGVATKLSQLDREHGERGQIWPQFLPNGRHFLYFSDNRESAERGVKVGSLDGVRPRRILRSQTTAIFAAPNQLLFVRGGTLFNQIWDPSQREATREPVPIVSANGLELPMGQIAVSASENGVVVYRTMQTGISQLVQLDRAGRRVKVSGTAGRYSQISLSPDERMAAINVVNGPGENDGRHIVLLNLTSNVSTEPQLGNAFASDPVWSPDSRQLAFATYDTEGGKTDIVSLTLGDPNSKRLLLADGNSNKPDAWSPDGGFLLCRRNNERAFTISLKEGAHPRETGDKPFFKDQLTLSPDGRTVAYNTWAAANVDEPEQQVFVASFPDFRRAVQASAPNGVQPIWSANGHELLYLSMDGALMSVKVNRHTTDTGQPLTLEPPKTLLQLTLTVVQWGNQYAVSRDGHRIHVLEPVEQPDNSIHIITQAGAAVVRHGAVGE